MEFREEVILLDIRKIIYSFLSSVFLYSPDPEQLKTILDQQLFDEFPLEIDSEDFREGLSLLLCWTKVSKTSDINQVLEPLDDDYNRLFIGPGHLLAPPWESVYLTEEKLTFGEPTLAVREFYLRHGLEFFRKNAEPDDHIGLELEFMSKLIALQHQMIEADQTAEAAELEKAQLTFLQDHLMKWSDDFTHDIYHNAATPYFQGLSLIAKSFLTWDYQRLSKNRI